MLTTLGFLATDREDEECYLTLGQTTGRFNLQPSSQLSSMHALHVIFCAVREGSWPANQLYPLFGGELFRPTHRPLNSSEQALGLQNNYTSRRAA